MNEQTTLPTEQPDSPQGKLAEAQPLLRQSQTIAKLAEALAKAQGEFEKVEKSAENPFFSKANKKASYADMASVIAATRQALSKHGISVIQSPRSTLTEGQRCVVVATMLIHSSGEWIADELAVPIEKGFTAQSVGSAVTYARRYALQSFLCVAGEDDDGNAATGNKVKTEEDEKQYVKEYEQKTQEQTCIAPYQQKAVEDAMKATGKTEEDLRTYLELAGYKRLEHVLKEHFNDLIKWANAKGKAHPKKDEKKPDGHNWPSLFAKAREKGVPEEDVKRFYRETYSVEHGNDLTQKQFLEVVTWVAGL
jgi:ERF superfamily protein